uniref:DUF674 domain-containing protein n=1 Tax=Cajanus cajan TaxID=3821 RepID=A0A151U804_CAJCA|nr:hypothetical protein KK1_008157 [Cajanus cajan]
MASCSTKLTMKLLIDSKSERVLFGEASKEVIDFLFSLLCLPLSTITRLLNKNDMLGSIGNLYQSVENLSDTYMQPNLCKDVLLKPRAPQISALLPSNDESVDQKENSFYMCRNRCNYSVTCDNKTSCPNCGNTMSYGIPYVGNKVGGDVFPNNDKNGYVKEVVTYMIMDDLVIQPMSTISSIVLLNKFNVKEVCDLEEKVVELGMDQGINILKASLQSKMVLTSAFLKNSTGS